MANFKNSYPKYIIFFASNFHLLLFTMSTTTYKKIRGVKFFIFEKRPFSQDTAMVNNKWDFICLK